MAEKEKKVSSVRRETTWTRAPVIGTGHRWPLEANPYCRTSGYVIHKRTQQSPVPPLHRPASAPRDVENIHRRGGGGDASQHHGNSGGARTTLGACIRGHSGAAYT